jgi:sarcosine oxidase subunit beta
MHAPAAGLVIAEEVLDGEARSVDLSPFRLERFDGQDLTIETAVI